MRGYYLTNREQKRKIGKQLKAKGHSKKEIDQYFAINDMLKSRKFLQEGQRVKLNLENMKSQPDYDRAVEKYRNWVESHSEDVFTVEYDEKHKNNPTVVCLAEDDNIPKWLFWEGELEVVK